MYVYMYTYIYRTIQNTLVTETKMLTSATHHNSGKIFKNKNSPDEFALDPIVTL